MRAAIYARFSSDLQDARSLSDQTALCRSRCEAEGWAVVKVYSDAAISGAAIHNRPALLDLMDAARARKFDIVVTESLDRLSRDLEDIAGIHKRLEFAGCKIVTLADGIVGTMHVGLKGLISQMFLADLAAKTRRGHVGRLREGLVPGGRCYGYDIVPGEPGRRTINAGEADVIRRIFREYAAGRSPIMIAAGLNADGIRSPAGRQWNQSTINGSAKRQSGILQNRLYAGQIVYGRQKMLKDPSTGRRTTLVNDAADWMVQPAPDLVIVEADLFEAVQAQRARLAQSPHISHTRRPRHVFSGLMTCGCCGGSMIVVKDDRVGCSARKNRRGCDNRQTIALGDVEGRILDALRAHLLAPEVVAAATEAYRQERRRLERERAGDAAKSARALAEVDRRIARIVAAIEDGSASSALVGRLAALEAERRALEAQAPQPSPTTVTLHPNAAERYAAKVTEIRAALATGDAASRDVIDLVRELIERITLSPRDSGAPMAITIDGNLSALLERNAHTGATSLESGSRYQRYRPPVGPRIPVRLTA